ncbi:MAG: hypothetical protein LUO82_03500, partial [Methanomicrobiales archaeon]|nr:hypothetical protein [Methanomicrobiales archaeon]
MGFFRSSIDLYDHLHRAVDNFTSTSNWMLLISTGTFLCSLVYFSEFFVSNGVINYRLIPLSVLFFGISAMVFSFFRGILFMIQSLIDRSQESSRLVESTRMGALTDRAVHEYAKEVHGHLSTSASLWWEAHRITIRIVFILIPGFLFYFLGLASLLA